MDQRVSVPTGAESSELMQPTERAFDEPTRRSQPGFALTAMRDQGFNPEPMQQLPQRLAVERFVGDQRPGLLLRSAWLARDGGHLDDQRQAGVHIMLISSL